ncbi:MAG: D-alanyl-D-alanine carboxypeptidase/D-alanyl-D-alanine-endopeptidase [Acidimicrobiales bacterium]
MSRSKLRWGIGLAAAGSLVVAACSSGSSSPSASSAASATTAGPTGATTRPATSAAASDLPEPIKAVMTKPRYADATWSLLVTDLDTGQSSYELNADQMSLTGSTRKLFSVGMALNALGADARQTTPVHRMGTVDPQGALDGNLVLVAGGDLTFGGRRIDADTVAVTDFDHNDANGLGSAVLTPQDPLYALDQLASQVKAAGITSVKGDVVVDDRLFQAYRVPNGNLLISPMLVNENMVDVTITPTQPGQPATVDYRPKTAAFTVDGSVSTGAAGTEGTVELSGDGKIDCIGTPGCTGTVSGDLPEGYVAPLTGIGSFVHTFRVEDPTAFARTAFIEALQRNGVTVTAPPAAANPAAALPEGTEYPADTKVASYQSPPFDQNAKLVLKVSLNLGANLDLSLFGLTKNQKTVEGALLAERQTLVDEFGLSWDQFDFPTNGSGTPDSRAAPRALVQLLTQMAKTPVAAPYQAALPVLGVDGSLATSGTTLPGKGHVFAKPGTTVSPGPDGTTPVLKAQNLAGYIETKSGRKVAYALMVNDAGPVKDIAADVGGVFEDEATISSYLYENL